MKLFHKIFLCFVVVFSIAFQVAGFLLINFSYENAIEQEKKFAFQEFQYNKYILQSIMYSEPELIMCEEPDFENIAGNFTAPVAVYGEDKKCIFSNLAMQPEFIDFNNKEDDRLAFQVFQKDENAYIFVNDCIRQDENTVYLITKTDISQVVDAQRNMSTYFQKIYLVILCVGFPVIILLTNTLTSPIKKVSRSAKRIAEGRYSERIGVVGQDEISELASDFNQMAEKVEEKIVELSNSARQKEDFTANFAHELKTPLTSVIGYADMLYQKDLPREQVKSAAEYILNEGMRLESLSLKLMDLFILDKQSFFLERISVKGMFENLVQGIEPMCKKYGVELHMDIAEESIEADYDLFKTMILNLVDNALKADCKDIWVIGKHEENQYEICLKDNGKGIPPGELERITEAFYMVDKSRSRKQHGAGLGMALVSKIVEIHKAEMKIESDGETGTAIYLTFHMPEGGKDE